MPKTAETHSGVLDHATLLAKLRGFAQSSEVAEAIAWFRAGIVFHARGLGSTVAEQILHTGFVPRQTAKA